jgi:hypothetical protein
MSTFTHVPPPDNSVARLTPNWRGARLNLTPERLAVCRQTLMRHAPEVADWSDAEMLALVTELVRTAALFRSILTRPSSLKG